MIIFCHVKSSSLEKVLQSSRTGIKEFTWGILGEDFEVFQQMNKILGGGQRNTRIGPLFQRISREIRTPMLDYFGRLSKINHSKEWWATGLAAKSVFQQRLYLHICYIKLIKDLERDGEKIVLYVVDYDFFQYLKRNHRGKNLFLSDVRHIIYRVRRKVCDCIYRLSVILRILQSKLIFRNISPPTIDMETLVFSWVLDNNFDENNKYKDEWGGIFFDEYSKLSTCKRLTYSILDKRTLVKAIKCGEDFVYPTYYCSWWEILSLGLFARVRIRKDTPYSFYNINTKELIKAEIRRGNRGEILGHLLFYAGLSHILRHSLNLRIVFHPFEGQPWEKMMKFAINEARAEVKTFGFQHASFSDLDLNQFCSSEEYQLGTMPDFILANSNYHRERMCNDGYPEEKILNIGNLRFTYLQNKPAGYSKANIGESKKILLCLTALCEQSLITLWDCSQVFRRLLEKGYSFKVFVKPHPLRRLERGACSFLKGLEKYVEFYHGGLPEIIRECEIVIYVNGAVVCEALCLGKVTIQKVADLVIDLDPLRAKEKKKFIHSCYFNELEDILESILQERLRFNEAKEKNVPVFFDPVQARTWGIIKSLSK